MKDSTNVLTEITQLTNTIKTNYPGLYRDLNENPMTIPTVNHPKMDNKMMEEYLESLKQLLEHYLQEEKNRKNKL